MSEFVNYNKRSIDLPPGCKNLFDVLQPIKAGPKPRDRQPRTFEKGTLASIPKHIGDLLKKTDQAVLLIYDARGRVAFYMTPLAGNILASIRFLDDPARETRVRKLFGPYGLDAPTQTETAPQFPEAPVWTRFTIQPFPSSTRRLIEIATAVFRDVCNATDKTPLHFRHYSISNATLAAEPV